MALIFCLFWRSFINLAWPYFQFYDTMSDYAVRQEAQKEGEGGLDHSRHSGCYQYGPSIFSAVLKLISHGGSS